MEKMYLQNMNYIVFWLQGYTGAYVRGSNEYNEASLPYVMKPHVQHCSHKSL